MGLRGDVSKPQPEHPKRPVDGLSCTKSEVSGRRLWGLFAERYPMAKDFFEDHFVANYCPLVFMEEGGRNRTPDKLSSDERTKLEAICDRHLQKVVEVLKPRMACGGGWFCPQTGRSSVGMNGCFYGNDPPSQSCKSGS
jgi:single-strand selective monofunctional uracil DNA glycosylase